MSRCGACGAPIPNKTTYDPRADGCYVVRMAMDPAKLLEHLREKHPRPVSHAG